MRIVGAKHSAAAVTAALAVALAGGTGSAHAQTPPEELPAHTQQITSPTQIMLDHATQQWFDLQSQVQSSIQAALTPVTGELYAGMEAHKPLPDDPAHVADPERNYRWANDPISQLLAGKAPGSGPVLHRVAGSWFDAPRVPSAAKEAAAKGMVLMGAGTPIYLGENNLCTLTAVGTDASGRHVGITAAHCAQVGDSVSSADVAQLGPAGTVVYRDTAADYAVIEFGSNAALTADYNGVNASHLGANTGSGENLCKFGVATGWTCGITWSASTLRITSHAGAMQGDSGAPVLRGNQVVGMVNGGILPYPQLAYQTPLQGGFFMPTQMTPMERIVGSMNQREGQPGFGFNLWEDSTHAPMTPVKGIKVDHR